MKLNRFLLTHILGFLVFTSQAQQIKRWTLCTTGKAQSTANIRSSWSASGCPDCSVLHPTSSSPYLRQGFQQPPETDNNPPGCTVQAVFNITPKPSQFCGTKYDFDYTGGNLQGLSFQWNFGETATPRSASAPNPSQISFLTPGTKTITLTVREGACQRTTSRIITVTQTQVGFGGTVNVGNIKCKNDQTGSVALTTIGGTGNKTYRWNTGATTAALNNQRAGNYSVTVADAAGCSFTIDTVLKEPRQQISTLSVIKNETCIGYADGSVTVEVQGGTKPYRLNWEDGSAGNERTDLKEGKYNLKILDSNNCKLDTALVLETRCKVKKENQYYDVISPNDDGKNDVWFIPGIDRYPNNELIIYNRWGQVVFNTKGYANNWAGTTNDNQILLTAAYYYVLRLNDEKNTLVTGSVSIIR
jgi:gliding motility-associated-like protein